MQATKTVCEHFGIEVLRNISERTGEENNPKVKEVCALGCCLDLDAGHTVFEVTPWFDSDELLEEFCDRHLERFLSFKEGDIPDATDWDT